VRTPGEWLDGFLALPASVRTVSAQLEALAAQMREMEQRMTAAESAAWDKFSADLASVRDGWAAKDAQIAVLQAALADAGTQAQAQVAAALEQDAAFDAVKITQADAALASLLGSGPPA